MRGPDGDPALARDRVAALVALATAVGLVARLAGLGDRPFHWDEARVGYWTLQFAATGVFEYRPVAGGPLLYVLGRWLFAVLPATDFVARLSVALVGGLLPASALLFRTRLRDDETVLLAVVLAASPLLLYYSRVLRGDLPLAAFALVAVGFAVRWLDSDDPRPLRLAGVAAGLAVAASGFALATLVVAGAAWALAFDHRRVAGAGPSAAAALTAGYDRLRDRSRVLGEAALALLLTVGAFYAPRGLGLLRDPLSLLSRTFVFPVRAFVGVRVLNRAGTELIGFVADGVGTLLATSGPLVLVAVAGFLADRYAVLDAGDGARPLVAFAGFWAGLGLLGYPIAGEVAAPWVVVHVAVPLSIPAAVGLAALLRYGRRAAGREDAARVAGAALLLLAVGVHGGVVAAEGVYGPQTADNPFTHYAQPADDLEPLVAEMRAALAESDDPRVVWVGEAFYVADESALATPGVGDQREPFGERLPLAWYVERTGAASESVPAADRLEGTPPVVVSTPGEADAVGRRLPDHDRTRVRTALWDREVVVFVGS